MRLLDDSRVDVQELPLPSGTVADDFKDGAPRDVLYARLMDYLVRRSNVLSRSLGWRGYGSYWWLVRRLSFATYSVQTSKRRQTANLKQL